MNSITPQTLLNMFNKKNIAIINTLKSDYIINTCPLQNNNLHSHTFTDLVNNKFDIVILYCANYTCPASHHYGEKLKRRNKNINIYYYSGGLFEWAMLSHMYSNTFCIYNKKTNHTLTSSELIQLNKDFAHWDEKDRKEQEIPKLVLQHNNIKNFMQTIEINNNYELLSNKVCVVTGGTSGLGLSVVIKMLDYGAKHVTGTYYNNTERAKEIKKFLQNKYGINRVTIIKADARTILGNKQTFSPEYRKKIKNLPTDCIPVDCVDINAGIFGPASLNTKHIHNIDEKDYDAVMDINLKGYFLGIKYFVKQALYHNIKDASIVCIKSIYGSTGSLFSNIAYQTSKHGVMGLVRQTAIELCRENSNLKIKHPIRINAISPTFTDTSLTKPMLNETIIKKTISNSNTSGKLAKKIDVANGVIFLLSNLSSSITGIDLPIDCGVLSESVPTYNEVNMLNNKNIKLLSCCGDTL